MLRIVLKRACARNSRAPFEYHDTEWDDESRGDRSPAPVVNAQWLPILERDGDSPHSAAKPLVVMGRVTACQRFGQASRTRSRSCP